MVSMALLAETVPSSAMGRLFACDRAEFVIDHLLQAHARCGRSAQLLETNDVAVNLGTRHRLLLTTPPIA